MTKTEAASIRPDFAIEPHPERGNLVVRNLFYAAQSRDEVVLTFDEWRKLNEPAIRPHGKDSCDYCGSDLKGRPVRSSLGVFCRAKCAHEAYLDELSAWNPEP